METTYINVRLFLIVFITIMIVFSGDYLLRIENKSVCDMKKKLPYRGSLSRCYR